MTMMEKFVEERKKLIRGMFSALLVQHRTGA